MSEPLFAGIAARARSTRYPGRRVGTGTATHSSRGRSVVVERFL